jgi:hypothetical protein
MLEKARIKSYLDYILSGCTQNSLVSAKKEWQTRGTARTCSLQA